MKSRCGVRWSRLVATALLTLVIVTPCSTQAQQQSSKRVRVVPAQEQALHDLLVKAKAEADAKDYSAAQTDYKKYLAQKSDDASAHFDLGYVYTAQQETEKAIKQYREAIALDPKMLQAHLNLGMSLLAENPKEAIAPLEKAVELDYSLERGHYALGLAEERAGDSAAAEKELTVAVKLDPDDAGAHAALARVLLNEKKASAAETQFRESLRLKSGDASADIGLAQSLLLQNRNADALAALEDYLKTNPSDARARVMQASLLVQMGNNDEALSALDEAAKSGPESLDALELRSEIYFAKKDWAKASAVLQKAEQISPRDAVIHARLGHVLLETRDYRNAARELTESLQMDPNSMETLRDLVSAEYLGKTFQSALAALDLLAKREPPNAGAWFIRGSCYDHMNQPKAALDAYNKFLAMNTNKNSNEYFEAAARARFLEKMLKQKGR